MVIHHSLDEVFRSWSHVAVLRALIDTTSGYTGNEVARVAGMHPRSALKALTALEQLGIVDRRRGGRDHLFTLNREHFIVKDQLLPLYHKERQFSQEVGEALAAIVGKSVISAVIFGSVAKREETPESDLDLCCIVSSESAKERVRTLLAEGASKLHRQFGVNVGVLLLTVDEMRAKARRLVVRDIVQNGILLAGKDPKKIVRG